MYNINSGVQFVGRPIEPPPYSEVIASPPREGPPPPYVSCENLVEQTTTARLSESITTGRCDPTEIELSIEQSHINNDLRDDNPPGFSGVVITSRSIPGPQVPTVSHISSNNSVVDNLSRPGPSVAQTFDLEYVETDALLSENSSVAISRCPSKATVRSGYCHSGGPKNRWHLSNDKRYYHRKTDKSEESSPLRNKDLSLADSRSEERR